MSGYTVTASAELMENFVHSDVLEPQDKFLALQTDAGASLLFSIGGGGVFNLTIEDPGNPHGWRLVDLGSARIASDFVGNAKAVVKSFGAAQTPAVAGGAAASINLAMVVSDGTNDLLYLSLGNSDADLAWADKPVWTRALFNAVDNQGTLITAPSPFVLADVFIGEATDQMFIVADMVRNPGQAGAKLSRYFIDITHPASPQWRPHDLAIDLQAAGYSSCLGRIAKGFGVDGLYTKGIIGASAQLVYTPLFNAFDPSMPPLPSRLGLPGALVADAIAAVRNNDNSSDLYVTAQGSLYWFASNNQKDGATGVLVATSPLLKTVSKLFAAITDSHVTIWGLNGDDEVFYLACPVGSQGQVNAWTRPLPIATGVDAISPFIDRNFSANTFFAQSGTGLVKLVKSPTTGLWSERDITLPPSPTNKVATPIQSYTTHIKVTDENSQVAANVPVTVSASNVTSVYVNHLYYLVGPSAIDLTTDQFGTITIVETVSSLAGTRFQVTAGTQSPLTVNTMDTAWQRNAAYTTSASLQSAQIVDRKGTTRPFIPAGTAQKDLDSVAQSNQQLAKAYASVVAAPAPVASRALLAAGAANPKPVAFAAAGVGSAIEADLGDLLRWLESGIEAVVQVVEDAATGLWHFVVSIGSAIYHAALDCIEAIVAAAAWVYNAIKVAIEDVVKFLQFIFGWQDILTTHKVMKNLFLCVGQHAVDEIDNTKTALAKLFKQLESEIDKWANIPPLPDTPGAYQAANQPPKGQDSAPANLGVHHFKGGAAGSTSSINIPNPAEAIFDDLLKLVADEGQTLEDAFNRIKTDIVDPFDTLSLTDIIKRLVAIMADTLLETADNILQVLLDAIKQLAVGMLALLTEKIDVPVLSWLYHDLVGEDLSFIDILCLVAAIPVTIIYKIAADKTPFPADDPLTKGLIGAQNFAEIQTLFQPRNAQAPTVRAMIAPMANNVAATPTPVLDQSGEKLLSFVFGICSLVGGIVLVVCTVQQQAADKLEEGLGDKYAPISRMWAALTCAANILYVSPDIPSMITVQTNNWYTNMNMGLAYTSIAKGVAGIGIAGLPSEGPKTKGINIAFASAETLINTAWNVPVIFNIIDHYADATSTYGSLIPESLANFAFNVGGMMELPIKRVEAPNAKLEMIADQAAFMLVYGLLSTIAGGIYAFADGQEH